MPEKKQQYKSASDSIFDFIFSSAKKNIRPDKPLKPSGATGNEMADALAEISLRPVTYAGEQALTPLNETINRYSLFGVKVRLSKEADLKMGVGGGNIANFFSNPQAFVESAFKKVDGSKQAAKNLNRIRGLGGILDLGVGAVLAKSAGMSSKEALRAGWEMSNEYMSDGIREIEVERHASRASVNMALGQINHTLPVTNRFNSDESTEYSNALFNALDTTRVERVGDIKKIVDSQSAAINAAVNTAIAGMTFSTPEALATAKQQARLTEINRRKDVEYKNIVMSRLDEMGYNNVALNNTILTEHLKLIKGASLDDADYNRRGHEDFWGDSSVRNDVDLDTELTVVQMREEREKERDNLFGPDAQGFYSGDKGGKSRYSSNKYRFVIAQEIASEIAFLSTERQALVASGGATANIDSRIENLNKKFWTMAIWQRSNGADMKWSKRFGEFHGHTQAFNQMVLEGGGLSAILSGEFFDVNSNAWSPSKEQQDVKIKAFGDDNLGSLKVARDDRFGYYRRFNHLYYLTPGSVARTFLVNGEGFVYLGYLKEQKIIKSLTQSDELFLHSMGNSAFDGILDGVDRTNQDEVLKKLSEEYTQTLALLTANRMSITDPNLVQLLDKLNVMTDKLKNSKMLKYAKGLQGVWDKINKFSPKKILENAVNFTLLKIFGQKVGKKILGGSVVLKAAIRSWVAKKVAKLSLHAIGQSLGLALGGVANGLIYVATEVIYFLAEKFLKPVIQTIMFFIWGIILLVFVVVVWGGFGIGEMLAGPSRHQQFNTARGAAPINCEECSADFDESNFDDWAGWDGVLPEDYDGFCPLGDSMMHCSQGPGGSFSHSGINAIDIVHNGSNTFWYAPKDGVVVAPYSPIYYSGSQKCGGYVSFKTEDTTYFLAHVLALRSVGDKVSKGSPVAKLALEGDGNINFKSTKPTCTTGAHWHIEVRGNTVPAPTWFRDVLKCTFGGC